MVMNPNPSDVICRCSGTTIEKVRLRIEQGDRDLDSISRATGACSGCGACDVDVMALLAEALPLAPPNCDSTA